MYLRAKNNPLDREIVRIPIERLARTYPGKIAVISEVKRSIKDAGLLNPLFVLPEKDGFHDVYVGNNRFIAAKKLGYTEIDCYIARPNDNLKEMDRFFKIKPTEYP